MFHGKNRPYSLLGVVALVALGAGGLFLAVEHFERIHQGARALGESLAQGSLWEDALRLTEGAYAVLRPYVPSLITLYALITAGVILLEHQNPDRTIAWILTLVLVPVLGLVLYFYLGSTFSRRRAFQRLPRGGGGQGDAMEALCRLDGVLDCAGNLPPAPRRLIPLLEENSGAQLSFRNEVEVLTNGTATFDALKRDMGAAQKSIHLEYFSIAHDKLGKEVWEILCQRAQQGVAVRVLYDAVGSWGMGRDFVKELQEAGAEIAPFSPVALPMLRRDFNFRNHRKIAVMDGNVGFLGGLNIGDMYQGESRLGFWRDTHLRIRGEAVADLQKIFLRDWTFATRRTLTTEDLFPPLEDDLPHTPLQIVASGPDSEWNAVEQGYFTLVASAQRRVWLSTPYLVPTDGILSALITAALGGVDVRLVMPSYPDHPMVYWASKSFLDQLLQSGVRVFFYKKGFIHAKVIIVDDVAASVGSTNMDLRSLAINFEIQAFLYHRDVVRRLETDFETDFADSHEVTLEERARRSRIDRAREAGARLLSSQL